MLGLLLCVFATGLAMCCGTQPPPSSPAASGTIAQDHGPPWACSAHLRMCWSVVGILTKTSTLQRDAIRVSVEIDHNYGTSRERNGISQNSDFHYVVFII